MREQGNKLQNESCENFHNAGVSKDDSVTAWAL